MPFWSGGMHKIVLCISLLFNTINLKHSDRSVVESIVHKTSEENVIELEITIISQVEDTIEMSIYFYDEKKEEKYEEYFSSSLIIKGRKVTTARIPFEKETKNFLNIIFLSNNLNENILDVSFPVYKLEQRKCMLSKERYCEASIPSIVEYKNNNVKEMYDKFFLIDENTKYYSLNNYIILEKIKISASSNSSIIDASLHLKDKIEGLNVYQDKEYAFPLVVNYDSGLLRFDFLNNYYVDLLQGSTHEDYIENAIFTNKVLLPYDDKTYDMYIEVETDGVFNKIIIEFEIETKGKLYGTCKESKYCLRRNYSL